jgi:peptide chain release factor 1
LSLESGVHRVQRVPKTEKAGRIHTSTSTVSLLPTIDDLDIKLEERDLRIETKKASGAGGQHVNTTESAVRITHIPTGITVDCQTERSQIRNRAAGLKLLMNKVYKLEYEKSIKLSKDLKKLQIGFGERSDKIRTYNYPQDRVTDHRYGFTVHNVQEILQGRELYDDFLAEIKTREVDRVLNLL